MVGTNDPEHLAPDALLAAVVAVASDLDLQQVLQRIVESAAALTDARYGAESSDVVAAARGAGVRQVYLAGPEAAVAESANRPDGYLTARIDAVEALSTLLTRLGA